MRTSIRLSILTVVIVAVCVMALVWQRAPLSTVARAADGGPTVTIGSPVPLPVTQTPGQPIQIDTGGTISGTPIVLYTVPAGKRLIVEHFSSEAGVAPTTTVNRYLLGVVNDPAVPGVSIFNHFIAPAFSSPCGVCAGTQNLVVASQPIRMYVDAGKALVSVASFSGPVGPNAFMFFSVSGYLVDVP